MNSDRFHRAYPPKEPTPGAPALYLPLVKGRDLVIADSHLPAGIVGEPLPLQEQGSPILYLGDLNGSACLAYRADEIAVVEADRTAVSLRSLYGILSEDEYALAGYATHLLYWQGISGFCGRCGTATIPTENAWAKTCPACGNITYPLVSPAVLILVYDDANRILLSHKPGWGERYSILAGFTEPGETLEECVARETLEEVGLSVTDIVYHGSQPWPYPHQLMIGFTARCTNPDTPMTLDETELDKADWFTVDALPELPGKLSLSRQLIDAWYYRVTGK